MCNIDRPKTQRMKDLQRWANKPCIYWSIDIDEYTYDKRKWERSEKAERSPMISEAVQ